MKDFLLLELLIYLVNLDINVSKREKNIDQNAAAFILQGAIDFLNN